MGLPTSTLIRGILQHGVSDGPGLLRDSRTPRIGLRQRAQFLVYSRSAEDYLRVHGVSNALAIGSPWAYLYNMDKHLQSTITSSNQMKFLVFPMHHSLSVHVLITREQIRKKIQFWKSLANGNAITICLLWTEFLNLDWREVCHEEGVELTFAGVSVTNPIWSQHISRVNFLPSIMRILQAHTHSIFECPTSAIYYALSMGHSVGYFQETQTLDWESVSSSHKEEAQFLRSNIPLMIGQFTESQKYEIFMKEMLGFDVIVSPTDLKEKIEYSIGVVPT